MTDLPEAILKPTRKHFGRDILWHTEETLHAEILNNKDAEESGELLPEVLWFFVCGNWDVFANVGTLEPWWCLGNLKKDSVESIVHKFENDGVPGLRTLLHESAITLAERYGDPTGQKIYSSKGDLLSLYRGKHCEKEWNKR